MKFLEKYNFTKEDIDEFINNTPKKIMDAIKKHRDLVEENLGYLQSLGPKTYREIFINFPDLFFMDSSDFKKMLAKYEIDSLLERLNENIKVVEYL